MLILMNTFFIGFIFAIMSFITKCQSDTNTEIELNKTYNGTMGEDNSFRYFKIVIPNGVEKDISHLIFKVEEPEAARLGKDDFSDPDIYISTTNKFPKSPEDSEYYSEQYGEDTLSIPKSKVFSGQVFYVTIWCQFKCEYSFHSELGAEILVIPENMYHFRLTKGSTINLKFQQDQREYKELEFISFSPRMSPFRMYVSDKETANSQNTLEVIPSWAGGYFSSITKNSNNYCTNCNFTILLEPEFEDAFILFKIRYENSVTQIMPHIYPMRSTLKPFNSHCYFLNVPENFKNEDIIIQTELFSGSANMLYNPWKLPDNKDPKNFLINKEITGEDVTIVTPEKRNSTGISVGDNYICLKSYDYTSYLLKVYFASQSQQMQRFNFLFSGFSMNGYLPAEAVTRYQATEFSYDSDIFFNMKVISGTPKLYGYVCENLRWRTCFFNKNKTSDGFQVIIKNEQNTCHKKLSKEDFSKTDISSLRCGVMAIIYCEGSKPCQYKVQSTHTNSIIKLRERKPHYKVVEYNKTDTFKFKIENEHTENITVILNSITGDADMEIINIEKNYESVSYFGGLLPDVITIDKNEMKDKDLRGEYTVNIRGATFASYSLLYYTHKNNNTNTHPENKDDKKPISHDFVELEIGQIQKDFIIEFQNYTNYKVYKYNQRILPTEEPMDIRITLTPEHSRYKMYVTYDIENMEVDSTKFNAVNNFIWKSNYNNEIIIDKNDPNYRKEQTYYIVIVPTFTLDPWKKILDNLSTDVKLKSFFYIGVTNEFYPFILKESIPSAITLTQNFTSQSYFYYHFNMSNPVSFSLNVFYGKVDIFVDFKWTQNITESETAVKIYDTHSTFFQIPPEKLKENAGNLPSLPLYILVKKTDNSTYNYSRYLLSIKSSDNSPEDLQPDVVRNDKLLSGEVKYFNINVRKTIHGLLDVIFKIGYGEVFINIFNVDDYANKKKYPNKDDYMFKADNSYIGKTFKLNKDTMKNCESVCRILIAVSGNSLGYTSSKIEYDISYYQEAMMISQNQPNRNSVEKGEMKFFKVFFPKDTKNVYFSLTNMAGGDADLYVNRGDDLPTAKENTWKSVTPFNEFVEFNKNDPYFLANKINNLSGNYTVMVYGWEKTSFTLYVTSHEKRIIPLRENSMASCNTQNDNEFCYFRFDDLLYYEGKNNKNWLGGNYVKRDLNLILNTEFLYGHGFMYAKLYNGSDYDILNDFPSEDNNDFSNSYSNKRNLLRIFLSKDDPKFSSNSTLLLAVKCKEKCFFDITAQIQTDSMLKYLYYQRENLFYVSAAENKKNLFIYYNNGKGDLDFHLNALEGKADIVAYTNKTNYNSGQKSYNYEVKEIEKFTSDYQTSENQHRTISEKDLKKYENLYFSVKPYSDYTFSLKLTHNHDWTKIHLGKENIFKVQASNKKFYGYLHMHDLHENILLIVSLNNKNLTAYCYVKYVYEERNEGNNNSYDEVPNEQNSDFSAHTNNLMDMIAIRLPKPNIEKSKNKIMRINFAIHISYFRLALEDVKINILAVPEINNVSKSVIPQNKFVYSLLNGFTKESNSTIQVYDLKRKNKEEDILTIEISSCRGEADIILSKDVIWNKDDSYKNKMNPHEIEKSNGRTVYKFFGISADNYYLMLTGKSIDQNECREGLFDNKITDCNSKFSNVLVNYHTSSSKDEIRETVIPRESIEYDIIDSESISLKWTPLYDYSNDKNLPKMDRYKLSNAKYDIFISNSFKDFSFMDSVCYLNHMKSLFLSTEINDNKKEAVIKGFETNKKYFINILAKKTDNSEAISYKSIEIIIESSGPSMFNIILISLAIIILAALVFYFYRKYKFTKLVLDYEVNDVRNQSLPRSQGEMKEIVKKAENRNYTNLTEDSSPI